MDTRRPFPGGDLDCKSEALQTMNESVNVPNPAVFVEVIRTEVFIEGAAFQHFVGGDED